MLSNRITMANLRGQDANQVGDIPPDQLALLQEEARSTLDMAKKALDWIETLIALRYEQCAIAARGAAGKDVGGPSGSTMGLSPSSRTYRSALNGTALPSWPIASARAARTQVITSRSASRSPNAPMPRGLSASERSSRPLAPDGRPSSSSSILTTKPQHGGSTHDLHG